jgi:hypothetical protein
MQLPSAGDGAVISTDIVGESEDMPEQEEGNSEFSPDAADVLLHKSTDPTLVDGAVNMLGQPPHVNDIQAPFVGLNTALNDFELGRKFWATVFPQYFPSGKGGLHEQPDSVSETDFIEHALLWHGRQFARDPVFIFLAYHRRMRAKVGSVCLLAAGSAEGAAADAPPPPLPTAGDLRAAAEAALADNTVQNAATAMTSEVQKLLRRLTVFGKSLPCTPVHMQLEKQRLLAIIASGVLDHKFTWFLTYGANDLNWLEIYRMILGRDMDDISKEARRRLLAENPLIATMHYFQRERSFWKHIIGGDGMPIGEITEFWKVSTVLQE